MRFKDGLDDNNGCDRITDCPFLAPRCCIRCDQPCKRCTPALVFYHQTGSWKERICNHLKPSSELAWEAIFNVKEAKHK